MMIDDNPVHASALRALAADAGPGLWPILERDGFTLPAVPVELGGAGGELRDELAVIHASAVAAARCPLAETAVAGALLAQAGRAVPGGPLTFVAAAGCRELVIRDATLDGRVTGVPWGRLAVHAVLPLPEGVALVALDGCAVEPGSNLAGEARDTVRFCGQRPVAMLPDLSADDLLLRGALMRSVQICGAAEQALSLAIDYARTRVQFGKPLASFQAIQHQIAGAASRLAAARVSVEAAYHAVERDQDVERDIASARINACLAGADCAAVAHQVHGAMGYAWEYDLHRHSSAIQAWRAEFGSLAYWAERLGRKAGSHPAHDLWQFVTS
jgi:acyl-CoA dehydrogenase